MQARVAGRQHHDHHEGHGTDQAEPQGHLHQAVVGTAPAQQGMVEEFGHVPERVEAIAGDRTLLDSVPHQTPDGAALAERRRVPEGGHRHKGAGGRGPRGRGPRGRGQRGCGRDAAPAAPGPVVGDGHSRRGRRDQQSDPCRAAARSDQRGDAQRGETSSRDPAPQTARGHVPDPDQNAQGGQRGQGVAVRVDALPVAVGVEPQIGPQHNQHHAGGDRDPGHAEQHRCGVVGIESGHHPGEQRQA